MWVKVDNVDIKACHPDKGGMAGPRGPTSFQLNRSINDCSLWLVAVHRLNGWLLVR